MVNDTHVLRGEPGVVKIAYTVRAPIHKGVVGMPLAHSMGQYCYLNIPRISRLEWHPFTISSAPVDMVTTHHIKVITKTTVLFIAPILFQTSRTLNEPTMFTA